MHLKGQFFSVTGFSPVEPCRGTPIANKHCRFDPHSFFTNTPFNEKEEIPKTNPNVT